MTNIEDSNKLISWWHKRLACDENWNSLPKASKKQLLVKLQSAINALLDFHITQEELAKLVKLTDIVTVFESCVSVLAFQDLHKMNRYQVLSYLTRVVLNSELAKFRKNPVWHSEPKKRKKRGRVATLEYAKKYDPYNFKKRHCSLCGKRIRIDNVTGICTSCQKKGRNGN